MVDYDFLLEIEPLIRKCVRNRWRWMKTPQDDIVQEVMLRIFARADRLPEDKEQCKQYCVGILRHTANEILFRLFHF